MAVETPPADSAPVDAADVFGHYQHHHHQHHRSEDARRQYAVQLSASIRAMEAYEDFVAVLKALQEAFAAIVVPAGDVA